MTDIDENIFEKLENLSFIKCTKQEKPSLLKDLKKILKYIEQLNEIDTKNTKPCNFVLQDLQQNIMREDEIEDIDPETKNLILENFPDKTGTMLKIPPFKE